MDVGDPRWIEVLEGEWDGSVRLRVRGRSMWPTLRPGDRVTVEPATRETVSAGDWVLLRGADGVFLHRLLGFTRQGLLLTKGDAHRFPDHPWPPEALLARAVSFSRRGETTDVSTSSLRERARTLGHRLMGIAWSLLRRVKRLLLVVLLALVPTTAWAAVTLVSFEAVPEGEVIHVTWETASEVDMFGFYVQRAFQESGEYERISGIIWAEGDLFGANYGYDDEDVSVGQTYYYRLEAEEVNGSVEFHGPISATLPLPVTETPTPTSTPTATPEPTSDTRKTSTPTPTPTPTSTSGAPRAATETPTPTYTPTSRPSASATPTATASTSPPDPTSTATARADSTATRTRMPAPTSTPTVPSTAASPTPSEPPASPTGTVAPALSRTPSATPDAAPSPTATATPTVTAESGSVARAESSASSSTPSVAGRTLSSTQDLGNSDPPPSRGRLLLSLALAGVGSALILLGGWGLRRMERKS